MIYLINKIKTKGYLSILLLPLLFLLGSYFLIDMGSSKTYGQKYEVKNSTQMYWYPSYEIDNVSYYLFKGDDRDTLYCEYSNEDNDFYLCAWRFSLFKDPLFGWVKSKDLIIK